MTSDRVALKVIRELKLLDSPALREQWVEAGSPGTIEQWLILSLQSQLDVQPSRESNVITLNYKAPDPRFAAGMANAFAQAYIATTLELRAKPAQSFKSLFVEQTRSARQALEAAQARLTAFQREKGLIATDERLDVETARLSELSSQLTQLEAISAESASRQAQARGAQGDRIQEVLNSPLVSQLKADLSRNEARLRELETRFGARHPQVLEAQATISELRSRIASETTRITSGVGVTNTINRGRVAQVRSELASQRQKVLALKAVRDESRLLQRDVESAQRIYENLAVRQNQTQLETENNQSFANQLTVALPPAEHSSPRLPLNTALAVFVGALLGITVALLLELADRRIRSPDDVVATLALPVLGTLPSPKAKRYDAGTRSLAAPRVLQLEGGGAAQPGAHT
jgi:chain length determinant protein EpsF